MTVFTIKWLMTLITFDWRYSVVRTVINQVTDNKLVVRPAKSDTCDHYFALWLKMKMLKKKNLKKKIIKKRLRWRRWRRRCHPELLHLGSDHMSSDGWCSYVDFLSVRSHWPISARRGSLVSWISFFFYSTVSSSLIFLSLRLKFAALNWSAN